MNKNGRKLISILIVLFLGVGIVLVGVFIIGRVNQPNTLRGVFQNEDCMTSCWQGIEPSVTEKETVERLLDDTGIDYETTMTIVENDTFVWDLDDSSLLVFDEDGSVAVEFDAMGMVQRISLTPIGICVSSVVDAFGTPTIVNQHENFIELFYPEDGLSFFVNTQVSPRIRLMFLTSQEFVERFSEGGLAITWEEVESSLLTDCDDNFS